MSDGGEPNDVYVEAVTRKAERMARARRENRAVWVVLAQAGTLGWQFVLVLVGFTLAGRGLAILAGHDGPTLVGIVLGLALALWQSARTLRDSLEEDE